MKIVKEENDGDVLNDKLKRLPGALWTTSKTTNWIGERLKTLGDPRCGIETGSAKVQINPDASGLRSGWVCSSVYHTTWVPWTHLDRRR